MALTLLLRDNTQGSIPWVNIQKRWIQYRLGQYSTIQYNTDFLVERHNYLQDQAWKAQKTRHVALDDSIPMTKHYQEHIYFVFKLGEPALLGSKKIAYEYACISRYPWHMKNGIKNFREKHPGSIIILKMVNDPLRVWKKNHSITVF